MYLESARWVEKKCEREIWSWQPHSHRATAAVALHKNCAEKNAFQCVISSVRLEETATILLAIYAQHISFEMNQTFSMAIPFG